MTTTSQPTTSASLRYVRRPLTALAKAEYLQFRRNKTLIFMGTVFPVALPLTTFYMARDASGPTPQVAAAGLEIFAVTALLFVQYYSVLSLITTRRGEGVLNRLRTGEAADWQIQAAPAVPGALLTVVGGIIVAGVVYGAGSPAPVNAVALVLAVLLGMVVFSLLGLATSAITKNAEAAQITSLPVMILAFVGLSSIRGVLPERFAAIVDWTPFAALSDMIYLGAAGKSATAGESDVALDLTGTFTAIAQPLAVVGLWAALSLALVATNFRWTDRE